MACFLEELVIITNLIAKRVGYFAYRKVIKHSEASRKDERLTKELSISLVIICNVTLLWEELWPCFCRYDKLVHQWFHFRIRLTVGGTSLALQCLACVKNEVEIVTQVSTAFILKLNLFSFHIRAYHVVDLIVELRSDFFFWKDTCTGNGQIVFERAFILNLDPNALYILVDIDVWQERLHSVSDE